MKIKYTFLEAVLIGASVVSGLYYQAFNYGTMAKALSIGLGAVSVLLYAITSKGGNKVFYFWLLFCGFMAAIGFVSTSKWPEHSYTFVRLDLSSVVFILTGLILADSRFERYRYAIFKIILFSALFAGISAFLQFSQGTNMLTDRYAAILGNSKSYVLWGLTCNVFAYAGYTAIFSKKLRGVKVAVVLLYVFLGLLFQKRSVVVNAFVLCIIGTIVYNRNHNRRNLIKKIGTTIGIIGFLLVLLALVYRFVPQIQTLVDNTLFRITSADLENYDRSREANRYFENSNILELIFGYGIGHYFSDSFGLHGMLHIGYYNALYKGGIIYIGFLVYVAWKTIKAFYNARNLKPYSLACLCITISALFSMIFELSWGETILLFCYMPFIGHICMLDKYDIQGKRNTENYDSERFENKF